MSVTNFAAMFRDRVERFADRACLRVKRDGEWVDLSWTEVDRLVREIGRGLLELGFAPGDRLALLSENRPEWALVDLAVLCLGGATVPIYATSTSAQCAYMIKDSEARLVAVSNNFHLEKVLKAKRQLAGVEKVILFDPIKDITDKDEIVLPLMELRDLGRAFDDPAEFDRRAAAVTAEDVLTVIYTSGTTGEPKGVVLTHGNVFSNVEAVLKVLRVEPADVCLSCLPLSHSFERMAGHYTMLHAGVPIAYAESLDALAQNLAEVRPTVMIGVPRIFEKFHARIVDEAARGGTARKVVFGWAMGVGREVSRRRAAKRAVPLALWAQREAAGRLVFSQLHRMLGGRLRFFVSGGAPLSQEVAEFFHAAGVLILEGYGLTETSPVITCNTPESYKFGTVGRSVPGVEVKIADDGEILTRGPHVMKGYHKKPAATAEAIDARGWFHTGDIGEIDADGFLKITDRKKDLIITAGGKNVAPLNLEGLLTLSRYIEQANVIGDRRKFLTAVLVPAFPELEAWAKARGIAFRTRKELVESPAVVDLIQGEVDTVNAQLAKYETIKKFVLSDVEFTTDNSLLTPTLKVRRKAVAAAFAEKIARLYTE
jgi:long-chain acyl-CoA synthetase